MKISLPGGKSDNTGGVKDLDGDGQPGLELLVDDQQWIILAVPAAKQNKVEQDMTRQTVTKAA